MMNRGKSGVVTTGSGLPARVVLFSRFLKSRGFKAFSSGVIDAMKGLRQVDISCKEDFFSVLRMNMTSTDLEWRLFPDLFDVFWTSADIMRDEQEKTGQSEEAVPQRALLEESPSEGDGRGKRVENEESPERDLLEGTAYSPVSSVEKKDLGRFQTGDVAVAQLLLKNMMSPFRVSVSRRFRKNRRAGDIDFKRVMKKGMKTGGVPLALLFRRKKKRLKRLLVLADVSGSMDRYARFVMPFILGLRGIGTRAEVFVFSTSLSRITLDLRRSGIERILENMARKVPEWSGGTRIGFSLRQLNQDYGKKVLTRRTVVVIMSDGWDLGAKNLLKKEMEVLSDSVHSVIWLNPLAGDPEYSPLSKGLGIALPYVDHLLPADSLRSLKGVARTLARVMGQ